MSPAPHVLLSSQQLAVLAEDLATFPPASQRHGRDCIAEGRVSDVAAVDRGFRARVLGDEAYEILWSWDGTYWHPDCSCPVAPYCKHAYAAASVVIAESEEAQLGTDGRVRRHGSGGTRGTPALRGRQGGGEGVRKLHDARDYWSRFRHFQALAEPARAAGMNIYDLTFEEILRDPDADLMCWRLARAFSDLPPESFPPGLEEFLDRPELEERFAENRRTTLSRTLLDWAGQQEETRERTLRAVLGLSWAADGPRITVEARLTSTRAREEPRTAAQLMQLANEVNRRPGGLSPESTLLLECLVDRRAALVPTEAPPTRQVRIELDGTRLRALLSRMAGSPLLAWDDDLDPSLARRAGVRPGGEVRVAPEQVRILPSCSGNEGELWVELACVWPNGRDKPLREVLHLREESASAARPSYILAGGRFHVVVQEPPSEVMQQFREVDRLPIREAERETILGTLAARFPHVAQALAARTRFHRLQPTAALDLRDDDWLQVRTFARSRTSWTPGEPIETNDVVFEFGPDGRWTRLRTDSALATLSEQALPIVAAETPAPVGAEAPARQAEGAPAAEEEAHWFEAPQADLVEPLLEWMRALGVNAGSGRRGGRGPSWSDADVGWWLKLNRKTAGRVAEMWEERPAQVTFFGNPRIRRLLAGESRVRPSLKVEKSGLDWFSISAEWQTEGQKLTEEDLANLRASTARFVKISSGWVQRDVVEQYDAAAAALADIGVDADAGPQRVGLWELAAARPESLEALAGFGADEETLAAVRRLREQVDAFAGLPTVEAPPGLEADVRPYQRRGLDFLAYVSSIGSGAILADDMGLGKTLQALAWVLHLQRIGELSGPTLVVCPASVVHNWEREAARFAPSLRLLLLGSGKVRHQQRAGIPEHDLVITNYALLRRDIEEWRQVPLGAVILDEAQQIKNPDAAVTQAARSLQARHRLALTGTPLENRALDLFSIVDVLNPGYLGRRSRFQLRYDRPDTPPHTRALLAAKLRPILLRRTKREVAPELPERIEEQWDCEMTTGQRQLYLAEVKRSRGLMEKLSDAPGGIAQNRIHILAALTRLRQICCHPQLAGGAGDLGSGKFEALFELIEPILAEGHKVLVFSQFVECIRLLRAEMKQRGVAHHVLTGQSTRRGEIVDAFQEDPQACVFLISLKAGGTGLNLTAASYVVLFDPWWNPAVEAQAIDRTHRIGQDRTVIAYRLITRGSIEERIFQLQQRKASLVRDILGEEGFARSLSREDLDFLLEEA